MMVVTLRCQVLIICLLVDNRYNKISQRNKDVFLENVRELSGSRFSRFGRNPVIIFNSNRLFVYMANPRISSSLVQANCKFYFTRKTLL